MVHRDIYLRIEPVAGYSPLAPEPCARYFGRDFMRNPGHEIGRVSAQEIFASTFDALVYRQYRDPAYTMPVTDKLIDADINEPAWDRRVPGCVLYADIGDTLDIHVRNADPDACHSFHLHGLLYGIASDGAWPLGVRSRDGRRSDEILPGQDWTYRFEATAETVGVWAFHDHHQEVQRWVRRGLFGALIVRERAAAPHVDHEIPLFVHSLAGDAAVSGFESPTLGTGQQFEHVFDNQQTSYPYHCKIHGVTMSGTVQVVAGAPATVGVTAKDNLFDPAAVQVAPGGKVVWTNAGQHEHIVFAPGAGGSSLCLNGRSYVGNTPTIVADAGQRLRWYLINLDLATEWHNVHTHAARWKIPTPPGGSADVHPLSPTEGFTIDTVVPTPFPVLPPEIEALQHQHPHDACRQTITGDFLFHCHIESHMMQGLAGLVRARQQLWLTPHAVDACEILLPYADVDDCGPDVDGTRGCPDSGMTHMDMPGMGMDVPGPGGGMAMPGMGDAMAGMGGVMAAMDGAMSTDAVLATAASQGMWELLPCDSITLAVHFALLHTGKLAIFSGSGNYPPRHDSHTNGSVLWDYRTGAFTQPPISYDTFCCGQATLPNGDLLAAGGTEQYDPFHGLPNAAILSATAGTWTNVADMADGRWYPTLVSLADGRVLAVSGLNKTGGGNDTPEIYDPATNTWTPTTARTPGWPLYPHLFLLRDGRIFWTGASLGTTGLPAQTISLGSTTTTPVPGLTLPDNRDQAASVLLPPAQDQKVMVMGGLGGTGATPNADIADLSGPNPHYTPTAPMHLGRTRLNAVLLPDRTVFVSGGGAQGEAAPVLQSEIYDPQTGTWTLAATATVPRLYHSVAALLPDGRVATAGSNPNRGDDELRIELFHPPYLFRGARPHIEDAPTEMRYGGQYILRTPQARETMWVQLMRPMATTHSTDSQQRLLDIPFTVNGLCELTITLTDKPNLAPPGWWMLTIVDHNRLPSCARWVHLST
ncbi:galactose oxidase-like domain-containing protein [Streptomyces sp. NPDC037389]|uniref:galactose oxidase-like domain-containing protein n=1 Tax=Streptomyces sp. NPDC037389 TaxID=3155369 RepID=UPI0033E248DE